jgi:signal transduction histidine kinase
VIGFAAATAGVTLAAGVGLSIALRRLRTLRLQLVALALVATLLPLAAVVASGVLMFDSGHDLTILAAAAASASAAVVGGLLLARSTSAHVLRLQGAAVSLAHGDLAARADERGPRELADLAGSFNGMAARLEDLFDTRSQLVAAASHDLRTPLASIQAMVEALEDGLAEPDRYLPAIREQTTRLGGLLDDLFELARIDAGALTLQMREARLPSLVESCVRGVEAEARARGVRVELRLDDVPPVRCAPPEVERVLMNLLTNALRHTPTDGAVAVSVEVHDNEVCVRVEDSGAGIPEESRERIFERFWRADAARTSSGGGAGLGLAIARGLVEAHGGRIWAEEGVLGGARVCFTLPAESSKTAVPA